MEQQQKNKKVSSQMVPEMHMVDVKLGDAQMTYIQCVIQEGNLNLFKQIMAQEEGLNDFITSRDLYKNTCLHYVALFDDEDFIISVLEQISNFQDFAFKLKAIAQAQNNEQRTPMDFYKRGKSDSYVNLHDTLQGL